MRARSPLLALAACLGLAAGMALAPAARAASLLVTSGGDDTDPDERLTLREAILLSEGRLGRVLTQAEQLHLTGVPGKGIADTIELSVGVRVQLVQMLPLIEDDQTFLRGGVTLIRTIDGGGRLQTGLRVTAPRFAIENVEFVNFRGTALVVESRVEDDGALTLKNLRFDKTRRGLVVGITGKGQMTFDLTESDFTRIGINAVVMRASVRGNYNFTENTFEDLDVVAAVILQMGGGAGDITITYQGNTHETPRGTGSIFEELQHTGKIEWRTESNTWLGGRTGLRGVFRVEGEKNFTNNTYTLHGSAGCVLQTDPFEGVTLRLRLDGEVIRQNDVGCRLSLSGSVELSTRLLDVLDNAVGIDGFVRVGAKGVWADEGSRFVGNADVGLRVFSALGIDFDLFYRQEFLEGNRRGFDLSGFSDSIFIEHATIVGNEEYGIGVHRSHLEITNSAICFNAGDGLRIRGDGDVTASFNLFGANGGFDVRNDSRSPISARTNGWGPATTGEMAAQPFPSDIAGIWDGFDRPGLGFVDYQGWDPDGAGCFVDEGTPIIIDPPGDGDGGIGDAA